jgi:hypothetical protein
MDRRRDRGSSRGRVGLHCSSQRNGQLAAWEHLVPIGEESYRLRFLLRLQR